MKKLIALLLLASSVLAHPTWASATDLRVLIDVSGSMKANDPNALRRPAAELIARLLPPSSQAGVWLFGTNSRSLVPYGEVDEQWRQATVQSSQAISSSDQFTDIEAALSDGLSPTTFDDKQCHVILVTDGLIDLAAGAAEIRESRARIESLWTQKAAAQQCRIHTLALSGDADLALLNRLSQATGGLSAQLQGASELIPVILDALELALEDNRLPVSENAFTVDSSVTQQTIISLDSDQPMTLISPSGVEITPDQLPPNVEYQLADGFQLYQIQAPEQGQWQASQNVTVDRVLAESELSLRIEELPGTLELGQPANVVVRFTQTPESETSLEGSLVFQDNRQALDFSQEGERFSAPLELENLGQHSIVVTASDGIVERQLSRSVRVIPGQAPIQLETGATQSVEVFKAPEALQPVNPVVVEPQSVAEVMPPTNSGLTLTQWLWMIGAAGLGIVLLLAYWLSRAEKRA